MRIATQNAQGLYRAEKMYAWKQYLCRREIDICCVTETHLNEEREKMFRMVFEDRFIVHSKRRRNMKVRDKGSGGIAIMVRREVGEVEMITEKRMDGLMWTKIVCVGRKLFIATVYIVPEGTVRAGQNISIREELERDIGKYKERGMVMVLGDMNGRIGNLMSVINEERIYQRDNIDRKENNNGKELVRLMNRTGMVIMSGIRRTSKYTCIKEGKYGLGKSVVDHVCMDEGIIDIVKKEKVNEDVMELLTTDHAMVLIDIEIRVIPEQVGDKKERGRRKGTIAEIPLNRMPNKEVWKWYKEECKNNAELDRVIKIMSDAECKGDVIRSVEGNWKRFKGMIKAMEDWVRKKGKELGEKQYKYIDKGIRSSKKVAETLAVRKEAWTKYRMSRGKEDEDRRWRYFKWTRNKAKKALKARKEEWNKKLMKEIEELRSDNPKEYWRKLKGLCKGNKRKSAWDTAIDEKGIEVSGDQVKIVWKEAYEKLGGTERDREDFDELFARNVEAEVLKMEEESRGIELNGELDRDITLEEVKEVVKELAIGKAAGVDGIVNELLKYGGDKMWKSIWYLCNMCFEKEKIPEEWMEGMIFPIYKEGDRRAPLNYRGISLLSVVSKVYTRVLNARLS